MHRGGRKFKVFFSGEGFYRLDFYGGTIQGWFNRDTEIGFLFTQTVSQEKSLSDQMSIPMKKKMGNFTVGFKY